MSFGFGFGFPSWRTLAGGFSPAALFVGGQQGFFYDPSDLSTLFQDSPGTTPVTGVEQVVGLMLDKSKGLVLGSELVTNGDFSNGSTGWTLISSSVVGGALNCSAAISTQFATRSITVVAGRTYQVSFTITNYTSGNLFLTLGVGVNVSTPTVGANGAFTSFLVAGAGNAEVRMGSPSTGFVGTIDNISVRELPGNHATSTGAARPTLSARVNLLTKSEQFDDAAWTKSGATVTANSITAPDGTTTADALVEDTTTGGHLALAAGVLSLPNAVSILSVYVKPNGRTAVRLDWANLDANSAVFELTGDGIKTFGDGTISAVGNGWYRVTMTHTPSIALAGYRIKMCSSSAGVGTDTYTGDGTSGIYIWGADLRVANDGVGIPTYQRVNTATDYDSSGFPLYLRFGGTQAMSTGSIDFTATDKMSVFAGVRKLSDAAQNIIAELSANSGTNNGSWTLLSPNGSNNSYAYISKGTIEAGAIAGVAQFPAPDTKVITGLGDISGDVSQLRLNGTVIQTTTTDQGTGNFGNYPLYIGARNLASSFLNGQIYSLIGVGSAVSAGNISATESWVNGKTKAY